MATQKKFVVKNGLIASDLSYPTADGTANQTIVTDGAGNLSFGNIAISETVQMLVKNVSGGSLAKGTPIHQTGTAGQHSRVIAARADTAAAMPSVGVLAETLADEAEGYAVITGRLSNINTSSYNEGDVLFVGATGGLTSTKPTGESNVTQNIGIVNKVHASSGSMIIYGSGRGAATPNLNDGKIFIGNSSNQSTTATLNTSIVPESGNLYYTDARARAAISENSTQLSYNNTSGVLTFTQGNTDTVTEGSTNLYYTDARFDTRLGNKNTDNLSEGSSNLYHTTSRVNSLIDTRVSKSFVDALNVDADTLDGLNSTQFIRTDADGTIAGNLTLDSDLTVGGSIYGPSNFTIDPATHGDDTGTLIVRGNLQVEGTQTTINSTTVSINDLNIVLADSAANAAAADGAGITINGAAASLTYAATGDKFVFNKAPYYNTNKILTTADEGTGNSLDADTVDGKHFDDIISEATALAIALG